MTTNSPQRVLVVDDEDDIRVIVRLNLSLSGMTVGEATDGGEALDLLRDETWEACVLDLAMPRIDGFEVLKTLSDEGSIDQMAVVVLTAKGSAAVAARAVELGAHAHLTKPFSPGAVAQTVGELIALSPQQRRERRRELIDRTDAMSRVSRDQKVPR